jgi:hypothetical protein
MAHQQLPEAIEPAMRHLPDPAACRVVRMLLSHPLSSTLHMRDIASQHHRPKRSRTAIAGIDTEVLLLLLIGRSSNTARSGGSVFSNSFLHRVFTQPRPVVDIRIQRQWNTPFTILRAGPTLA